MSTAIVRPEASNRKIHSKDEFELCYLRHQYFRKAKYNPTEQEMVPFIPTIMTMARRTFYTYSSVLGIVGLGLEDVINIGRVHLTSYLGIFSVANNEDKLEAFKDLFFKNNGYLANDSDVLNKDKADFTAFIKQRFEDLIRVCTQKGKNIKGYCIVEYFAYKGKEAPPQIPWLLIEEYDKYGFKKIDYPAFRSARKKAKTKENVFKLQDLWFVAIPVENKTLGIEDFTGAGISPYDNVHNMTPEEILSKKNSEDDWTSKRKRFRRSPKQIKINKIKEFINKNYSNKRYAEEIATAYKMLKTLEA